LEREGAKIVFAPSVDEMYPEPDTRQFSYAPLDTVMEGKYRPGHFNGVCQIVSKLFMIVGPDRAYFGEKDFQQIAVIRAMIKDQGFRLNLCSCPIVREVSGLAMSSRNSLLSENEFNVAACIYKVLNESTNAFDAQSVVDVKYSVINKLNAIPELNVEYYEIVDGYTLQSVSDWNESEYIVGCITVFCGIRPVRLIDNITYKSPLLS
jgi:pantoate--beta-alanine ligase